MLYFMDSINVIIVKLCLITGLCLYHGLFTFIASEKNPSVLAATVTVYFCILLSLSPTVKTLNH